MKQDNVGSDKTLNAINLPPLLNRRQLATKVLGVSERSSHEITNQPFFPPPIELGPRILRWNLQEVLAALVDRAPRRTARNEPAQLAAARKLATAPAAA